MLSIYPLTKRRMLVIYSNHAGEVVSLWVGHSLSGGTITSTVYNHYSAEFQMREAKKVLYSLPV